MVNRDKVKGELIKEFTLENGLNALAGSFVMWLDKQPAEIEYKDFIEYVDGTIYCFGKKKEVRTLIRAGLNLSLGEDMDAYSDEELLRMVKECIDEAPNVNEISINIFEDEYTEYIFIDILHRLEDGKINMDEHKYFEAHRTNKIDMTERFLYGDYFLKELQREKNLIKRNFPHIKVTSDFRYYSE